MSTQNTTYDVIYKPSDKKSRYFHIIGEYIPNAMQDRDVYEDIRSENSFVVNKQNRVLARNEKNWGYSSHLVNAITWFDKDRYKKIFESKRGQISQNSTVDCTLNYPESPMSDTEDFANTSFPEAPGDTQQQYNAETEQIPEQTHLLDPLKRLHIPSLESAFDCIEYFCPKHVVCLDECKCGLNLDDWDLMQHLEDMSYKNIH